MDAAFTPFLGLIFSLIIATVAGTVSDARPADPAIEAYPADKTIEEQTAPLAPAVPQSPYTETVASGDVDQFAKCLTEKGAKMYGAFWCPHCSDQKKAFGASFQYISYVECDAKGENPNPQACRDAKIEAYPTWQMPGHKELSGTQSLPALADWSSCPYLP